MICYVCAQQGNDAPAAAICIACGAGLCPEHLVREELPMWREVNAGPGTVRHKLPVTRPRILCTECHHALNQETR